MVSDILFVILAVAGISLVITGLGLIYAPLAYLAAGVAALKLAREVARS